jgi:hypothetical protein
VTVLHLAQEALAPKSEIWEERVMTKGSHVHWQITSAVELAIGAAIVIGHNVYHVLPNEVPILFLLGWLSVRLRNGSWTAIGFKRPSSWARIVSISVAAATGRIVLGDYVLEPMALHFSPPIHAPEAAGEIAGNLKLTLVALLVVWTFAAFGEEIAYRGYLTLRGAETLGKTRLGWWIATVFVSVLFGFGHYYKGPAGMVDSAVAGLILGAAFLIAGRNLWAPILAHGFIDTFAVVAAFFAWSG